jgi:biopolymer transport protein ExbD
MPSVKLPRKSTDTDMTPFVDVAFLILSFFMLATKFKPPDPVPITTPGSVLSEQLPDKNAIMIMMDSSDRVFFTVLSQKELSKYDDVINDLNSARSLGLSAAEIRNYRTTYAVGVPFGNLKQFLSLSQDDQAKFPQRGIPVLDSANNELVWWISAAKKAFAGEKLLYLIKGDEGAKYPTFEAVVSALKRNDEFKYQLVTSLDDVPSKSELDKYQERSGQK